MDSTSVSLLRRLRQPDQEAAWQRFVDLYAPLVFHWGRNQGLNATDASDLVQDIDYVGFYEKPFLKFERLLETYLAYAPRGFRSFLASITPSATSRWISPQRTSTTINTSICSC